MPASGTTAKTHAERWSLETLLARARHHHRRIPVKHCVHIVLESCSALAELDAAPPAHHVPRDLTLETILVSRQGRVELADFSLRGIQSRVGLARRRFGYLPPEFASGQPLDAGRADVYALGVILYELLTGQYLFEATREDLLLELARSPSVPRIQQSRWIDPQLQNIASRALAAMASVRYSNASTLGAALSQYARTAHVASSPSEIAVFVRELLVSDSPS